MLVQHFHDTLAAGYGAGEDHQHHRHHHQRHQNFGNIGEKGDEVAREHGALVNIVSADPHHGGDSAAHQQHHNGHKGHHKAEGALGRLAQVLASRGKFCLFVVFAHIGFYHADSVQILLHHQIQLVGRLLQRGEIGTHLAQHNDHRKDQKGDHHKEHAAQAQGDGQRHHQRGDQHHRRAHHHTHTHHQRGLHRCHIVGQTCDEGRGGKALNIAEGELLHLLIFGAAQIGAEAHTGLGGQRSCTHTHCQRRQRHNDHFHTGGKNVGTVAVFDADVHDVTHRQRQKQLKDCLTG